MTYLAHSNYFCSAEVQLNIQRHSVISTEAYIQHYLIKGFPKEKLKGLQIPKAY